MSGSIPHDLLTNAGQTKSAAVVVELLSSNRNMTIREMTGKSGLTESQISSGIKQCKNRGWVTSHQGDVQGKGRPRNLWNLSLPADELVQQLESAALAKRDILHNALQRLKRELS